MLAAGWPEAIPGTTVNRACGSGQQAVDSAAQAMCEGGGTANATLVELVR